MSEAKNCTTCKYCSGKDDKGYHCDNKKSCVAIVGHDIAENGECDYWLDKDADEPVTNCNGLKHTPGPWYIRQIIKEHGVTIHGKPQCRLDDGHFVAFANAYDFIPLEEAKANARLIAAAPELLEALKAIRLEAGMPNPETASGIISTIAEDAIRTAEGGEE